MRKNLIISLISILASINGFSQDANLTKDETIRYLDKKIKAVVGQKEPWCQSCSDKIIQAYLKEVDGLIEIFFSQTSVNRSVEIWSATYRFNPKYIEDISLQSGNSTVRSINLFIPNNSGMKTTSDYSTFSKEKNITFLFLDNDPKNFMRIKKAFLYLKDLYAAEEDPFGE